MGVSNTLLPLKCNPKQLSDWKYIVSCEEMGKQDLCLKKKKLRTSPYDVNKDLVWRSTKWARSSMDAQQLLSTKLTNAVCSSAKYSNSEYQTKQVETMKSFTDAVD